MRPKESSPDVVALVAPNGLGHFRRQVGILSRLLEQNPGVVVHVECSAAQLRAAQDWTRARDFFGRASVSHSVDVLDPGVTWRPSPAAYRDGSLLAWLDRLRATTAIHEARLVISDNLAAVLELRPDALLVGSFLWGDVLATAFPDEPAVAEFASLEAELLDAHRPAMLCVRDIVMPAVTARTRAIPLDWMCEEPPQPAPASPRPRVAILGGATGSAAAPLARALRTLGNTGRYELTAPLSLQNGSGQVATFAHTARDYAQAAVAVCRPGVGTVTDCVGQRVPMVTLQEAPANPELQFIAHRLEQLGVAIDVGSDPADSAVLAAVARALERPVWSAMRARLESLRGDGLNQAASLVNERLTGTAA